MKALNPVTAVGITHLGSRTLLLAGEGCQLKIFDGESSAFLTSSQIFGSQAIHGIQCQTDFNESLARILVWGGRSIAIVVLLLASEENGFTAVRIEPPKEEICAEDWISDACIAPSSIRDKLKESCSAAAIIVTSHNVLTGISLDAKPPNQCEISTFPVSNILRAYGPLTILYSAHIIVHPSGQVFVAAGTVYGEVLLWKYDLTQDQTNPSAPAEGTLLHSFIGHDGSVFGVRIAEVIHDEQTLFPSCIIASCSDDRTIRLWDASDVLERSPGASLIRFQEEPETGLGAQSFEKDVCSTRCLATIVGHSSRIWGVSFMPSKHRSVLISNGEDSTCQTWSLASKPLSGSNPEYTLRAGNVYRYHTGKNVWSTALSRLKDNFCLMLTGGADGRIITYSIPSDNTLASAMHTERWMAEPSSIKLSKTHEDIREERLYSASKHVFLALSGEWTLHRDIQSAVPTYPSGTFIGTASLVSRPVTNSLYDLEYLYAEEGRLETDLGLSLQGSRRYVYRYQEANDCITSWFVKPSNQTDVDCLFHELHFSLKETPSISAGESNCEPVVITAGGYHRCVDDDYAADYIINHDGNALKSWSIKYSVKGPSKDYVASAFFTRKPPEYGGRLEGISPNTQRNSKNFTSCAFEKGFDSFKTYCWFGPRTLLCSTAHGNLLLGNLSSKNAIIETSSAPDTQLEQCYEIHWMKLSHIPHFTSQVAMANTTNHTAFLGASCGNIYYVEESVRAVKPLMKIPSKVAGLWVQRIVDSVNGDAAHVIIIASGLTDQFAHFASFDEEAMALQKHIELPLLYGFVVTGACFLASRSIVILGSRAGELVYYNISAGPVKVTHVASAIYRVHSTDAITVIQELPKELGFGPENCYFLTTGRNGVYAIHRMYHDNNVTQEVSFETVHASQLAQDLSIEGASFDHRTNDLYLWGFRGTSFAVWNVTKHKEVMRVACGGSHRSWAYYPSENELDGGGFVWTKASKCNVFLQHQASHKILQSGGHGREIKALAIFPYDAEKDSLINYLIATGAEDTNIRIFLGCNTGSESVSQFTCLGIISKHNTGIQQLQWSPDGRFLISAGGREELCVWRIQRVPSLGIGFTCVATGPLITSTLELRITDVDIIPLKAVSEHEYTTEYLVTTVYSDSTIRVWCFAPFRRETKLHLLRTEQYSTCCLLQIKSIKLGPMLYLISAGTDGIIAFWPLPAALANRAMVDGDDVSNSQPSPLNHAYSERQVVPCLQHRIHQSSIKCCAIRRLSHNEALLVTGGDDNAIALTRITYCPKIPPGPILCATLVISRAHASAITGLRFVNSLAATSASVTPVSLRLASASNDQWLRTWFVNVDLSRIGVDGIAVRKELKINSTIADASCMEVIPEGSNGDCGVILAGLGIEQVELPEFLSWSR